MDDTDADARLGLQLEGGVNDIQLVGQALRSLPQEFALIIRKLDPLAQVVAVGRIQ